MRSTPVRTPMLLRPPACSILVFFLQVTYVEGLPLSVWISIDGVFILRRLRILPRPQLNKHSFSEPRVMSGGKVRCGGPEMVFIVLLLPLPYLHFTIRPFTFPDPRPMVHCLSLSLPSALVLLQICQ